MCVAPIFYYFEYIDFTLLKRNKNTMLKPSAFTSSSKISSGLVTFKGLVLQVAH